MWLHQSITQLYDLEEELHKVGLFLGYICNVYILPGLNEASEDFFSIMYYK